jgi:hypothetical protein
MKSRPKKVLEAEASLLEFLQYRMACALSRIRLTDCLIFVGDGRRLAGLFVAAVADSDRLVDTELVVRKNMCRT